MSFFSFFSPNPFKEWPRYEQLSPLKVNLCDLSLNGIKIGDHWSALVKIGKPDNNALKTNEFKYQHFGLNVSINKNGIIDLFDIAVSGEQYDNLEPNEVDLICENGIRIHLNNHTMISDLIPHIGNEIDKEIDEDEINLVYEGASTIIQIDCSLDSIIYRITIERKK